MTRNRVRLILTLAFGIGLGWALAGSGAGGRNLKASSSDRWGDWAVAAGTIYLQAGQGLSGATAQDAIYYLNYRTGQLLATVPSPRSKPGGMDIIGEFAERDLVADFGLKPNETPHFLMTTANIGSRSDGWQPLFVFESTTGQVATYKVQTTATASSTLPIFELVDRRSDPRLGRLTTRR